MTYESNYFRVLKIPGDVVNNHFCIFGEIWGDHDAPTRILGEIRKSEFAVDSHRQAKDFK